MPAKTRCAMKILERKLKQPPITSQPTPRVPNEPSLCETSHRSTVQQHLPSPSPRVHTKDIPPVVQPIACSTRSHTKNSQPQIDLRTRAQLQQDLTVTPSQASQKYFPKALLALWSTPVIDLYMPVLNAETGETL